MITMDGRTRMEPGQLQYSLAKSCVTVAVTVPVAAHEAVAVPLILLCLLVSTSLAGRQVSQTTTSDNVYYFVNDLGVKVTGNSPLIFDVMTCQDGLVRFAETKDLTGNFYDIALGAGGNSWSGLRDRCDGCAVSVSFPAAILDCTSYATIWAQWDDAGNISLGTGSDVGDNVMFEFSDPVPFEIHYIAFASYTGQTGEWRVLIDESPVFTIPSKDGSTSILVPETTVQGDTILKVVAVDPEMDKIDFFLPDNHGGQFDIVGNTLILAKVLDFETIQNYDIIISASDGTNDVNTTLSVTVGDECDETPEILTNSDMSIPEELLPGTMIGRLYTVTDTDENDMLVFSLSGTDSNYFSINSSTGDLTVLNRLDRDGDSGHFHLDQLTLNVVDSCGQSASVHLNLTISDVNDNPPVCESHVLQANLTENSTSDILVAVIEVSDIDTLNNANFTLTVVDGDDVTNPVFFILGKELWADGTTVDFESDPDDHKYLLTIQATDTPDTGQALTARCIVIVTILPRNEYTPEWSDTTATNTGRFTDLEILESSGIGTRIFTTTANDLDLGLDGELEYKIHSVSMANGSAAMSMFSLDNNTGHLTTSSTMDRDEETGGTEFYDVMLEVTDKGFPSNRAQASLRVTLIDVNDNAPVVINNNDDFVIDCNVQKGDVVRTIDVTDADVTPGSYIFQLTYLGLDVITVNQSTGELILNSELTSEISGNSVIVVTVVDDVHTASYLSHFEVNNCSQKSLTTTPGAASTETTTTTTTTGRQIVSKSPLTSDLHDAGIIETWSLRAGGGVLVITLVVVITFLLYNHFTSKLYATRKSSGLFKKVSPTPTSSAATAISPVTTCTSVASLDYFL